MNGFTEYDSKELLRTARWAVKGLGRYLGWTIRVYKDTAVMVVKYRDKAGEEKLTNVAI
jgi:hypothetical protein